MQQEIADAEYRNSLANKDWDGSSLGASDNDMHAYKQIIKTVIADGKVTKKEKAYVATQRSKFDVTASQHDLTLAGEGWDDEEFMNSERGREGRDSDTRRRNDEGGGTGFRE